MKEGHTSVKIACNQASIRLVVSQKSLGSPAVSTTCVPGAEAIKVSVLSQAIPSVWCAGKREKNYSIHNEIANKMQPCIKKLLFHVYIKLNMFRATQRPSSWA